MIGIIVKKYEHFNRALNMHISSKRQYDNECAKRGYIPFEKAEAIVKSVREKEYKNYDTLSPKAWDILRTAKNTKDKKGNVKLGDRVVDAMKELGMSFNNRHCPKHYQEDGGFG